MKAFVLFVTLSMITLIVTAQSRFRFPTVIATQYSNIVNAMTGCQQGLVRYVEANPGVTGTIPAAMVDALLPPGVQDPGSFTYVVSGQGTATTFLTVPAFGQPIAIAALQKIANQTVTAGLVVSGQIVPEPPLQPVSVPAIVPNGVIALQTIVRNN